MDNQTANKCLITLHDDYNKFPTPDNLNQYLAFTQKQQDFELSFEKTKGVLSFLNPKFVGIRLRSNSKRFESAFKLGNLIDLLNELSGESTFYGSFKDFLIY